VTSLRIHDGAIGDVAICDDGLAVEPSGFIEWMRSPLSSRRNRRPDRVADDAFVSDRAAGAIGVAAQAVDGI